MVGVLFVVDDSEDPHLKLVLMRQQKMKTQGVRYANVEIPRMTGEGSGMWGILAERAGTARYYVLIKNMRKPENFGRCKKRNQGKSTHT